MKKLLLILSVFFLFTLNADAKFIKTNSINSIIQDSSISKNSISISVKDVNTGKTVYSLNDQILLHPASVQKLLTIVPSLEVLGNDYEFRTELYLRGKDTYIIKLGADPYLSIDDLKILIGKIDKNNVKKIYIDSSIIEKKDWGEGWQWDDDLNISMPRFNAYNLDNNLYKITVIPTEIGKKGNIININKAQIVFINNVITGDVDDIRVTRDNIVASNMLKLDGTVKNPYLISIPNNNLKRYFEFKLTELLESRNIYLKEPFENSLTRKDDKYIASVTHSISQAVDDVLKNSNNMVSEVIGKIASAKSFNKQGSDIDAVNLYNSYFKKIGLDYSRIRIVDSSGVSKNNLIYADFVSEFLVKNKDNKILEQMAYPGVGTLSERMTPLKSNLKAKTGTLSDISSISGFLTTKKDNKYAFCIIINDPNSKNSDKKNLENYIIRKMYYEF